MDIQELLKSLGLSVARGVPQMASGFVDLAALPFTATGLLKPEQAVGSTDWMTARGYLPPKQEGVVNETTELVSSALNPAGAFKSGLLGIGALAGLKRGKPGSYLINTPQNPNPVVGTRYDVENIGGLLDKIPVNLENHLGSSVMVLPWDSSSRNVAINAVSDIPLTNKVVTHGGQDYARDAAHQAENIVGASGQEIATRIKNREQNAIQENLAAGGTGRILHLPITMGDYAENFSVMPTNVLLEIIDAVSPTKKSIKELNDQVRAFTPDGKSADFKPFKNFKGIDTEEGRRQLLTGEGIDSTAGELRKAFTNRMYLKGNQERFGFNAEDIVNAILDPSLKGVPKGYVGNTVIGSDPLGMRLLPSQNPTYNTNFTGQYVGTMGQSIPVEQLMPSTFNKLAEEFAGKKGNLRQNVIGAMEKRNEGISEIIDDQFLENLTRYLRSIRE